MIEIDAGYYYGIGAFETILVMNGKPLFINEHMERLIMALEYLEIKKRVTSDEILKFIQLNEIVEGVLKIAVSEQNIHYTTRKNTYTANMYKNGFKLALCDFQRNETSPLTYHKTLNYAENILARKEAALKNCNEALFLNTKGEICEGSCSNIFFVKGEQLFTPSVSCGLLSGIIRNHICTTEHAEECIIKKDDINKFDECFITNSIIGIMSVRKIEDHLYRSADYTEIIRSKYQRFIAEYSKKSY